MWHFSQIKSAKRQKAITLAGNAVKEVETLQQWEVPQPPRRKRRRLGPVRIALLGFGIFVLLGCGIMSAIYYYYTATIEQPLNSFVRPVQREKDEPVLTQVPAYDVIKGRAWNILLMGSDNDQKFAFPAVLTQVMMVVHIDTVANTVSLVSIPRDSWVTIPQTGGMHKIDQAFLLGAQQSGGFDGGVQLARLTIEKDYGISIDRYAWVGLSGFAKVIDTLGGVDIDITHPIVDDTYPNDTGKGSTPNDPYSYTRLYIAPGPQHLDGEQVLAYVRSRHSDLVGDIGRTERQQQVLEALKQKLNLSGIIGNIPQLLNDLKGSVYTDMSQAELLAFASYARTLDTEQIQRVTLGPGPDQQDFGEIATLYDPSAGAEQSVILPDCAMIQPVVNRIFGLGDEQSCNVNSWW